MRALTAIRASLGVAVLPLALLLCGCDGGKPSGPTSADHNVIITNKAVRIADRDQTVSDRGEQQRRLVAGWQAVDTVPLTADENLSAHIASIPLTSDVALEDEQITKLRDALERFMVWAHENSFSSYWDFRVRTPYEDLQIPKEIREFHERRIPHYPEKDRPQAQLEGSVSNQLRIIFEASSFGTGRHYWHFEEVSYDQSSVVVFETNALPGSILGQVMNREFPMGSVLRTNLFFRWRTSREALLADGSPLLVATVRFFLASSATGPEHAYPVYLALYWDDQHQAWIPSELGACGNPPPQKSLFF